MTWACCRVFVSISRLAKTLGQAGEIEPETEGILTEYDVDFSDFSEEVLACLPRNLPWTIPPEELSQRRDLRWDMEADGCGHNLLKSLIDVWHCVVLSRVGGSVSSPSTLRLHEIWMMPCPVNCFLMVTCALTPVLAECWCSPDMSLQVGSCRDVFAGRSVSAVHFHTGNFEVGVHIADVSYFVEEGNSLDVLASQRATSVYLVQKVSAASHTWNHRSPFCHRQARRIERERDTVWWF